MREVIDAILNKHLFVAEFRRLEGLIDRINTQNKELKQSNIDGFIYGGKFYRPANRSLILAGPGQAKQTLHKELWPTMEDYLQDASTINNDKQMIAQSLFMLLKPCRTKPEMRDALPECIISFWDGLSQFPRTMPAGYTLEGNERAKRQFEKVLPKIEFYVATRLLY